MYGTCETLCRLLSELYPAETPLNLIVWSPEDIEALAGGMECVVSEQDKGGAGAHGRHTGRPAA